MPGDPGLVGATAPGTTGGPGASRSVGRSWSELVGAGRSWSERVRPAGARTVRSFATGPDAGHPAVTRHRLGGGIAWYVATAPGDLRELPAGIAGDAGVAVPRDLPDTLEMVHRGPYVFLVNHADASCRSRTSRARS
ncbi:beta-galactosidase trimerization domain-containing protein [Herbidospora galbida]|uniref:beta-galactosidase trimerization domain-containing protein n=1 Tax=Herbidospora galbida TaxID=2575442 RepID=UPI001FE46D49|nr:beta-galactosidase trimerization domain-containing protein [Herbidospora galbida]